MKKTIVINKTTTLVFLLMLPIIKPSSLQVIAPVLETVYDIGRVISVVVISLIMFFSRCRKIKFSPSFWTLLVLESWIVFVTVRKNPSWTLLSIINGGAIIAVFMIVAYFVKESPEDLLSALMANFEWLIYVHLFTHIVFPNGLYQIRENPYYFLGLDNSAVIYIIPALTISYLYYQCLGKRFRPIILVAACVASVLIGWCATAVVGLITVAVVILLVNGKALKSRVKLLYIWIASIVFDILITVIRIMDTFPPLRNFIVQFLGKNATLTGRTYIWDEVLLSWSKSPIMGNGYYTTLSFGRRVASHAHNTYFQYLLISGLIGLALFLIYNLLVIIKFDKSCGASTSGKAFKAAFAFLFMTYITEAYSYPYLFVIYALAECVPVFVLMEEKQNQRMRKIKIRFK